MTNTVINMGAMDTPVKTLLEKCGTRQEILADVQRKFPQTDLYAVHRWFQRDSVPGKYWGLIVAGAQSRGCKVDLRDMATAHLGREEAA